MTPCSRSLRATALIGAATVGAAVLALARLAGASSPATAAVATPPAGHAAHAAAPPTVKVTIREWRVTAATRSFPSGRVTFVVKNTGRLPHEFLVVRARGAAAKPFPVGRGDRAVLGPVAGRLATLRPGATGRVTVNLPKGDYILLCNLRGHYRRSKQPHVRSAPHAAHPAPASGTSAPAPATPTIKATTTLQLATSGVMKFAKTGLTAPEGKVTIVLTNSDVLPHNVAIRGNGVDVKGPEVPKGQTSSVTADLAPGTYTFYCAVSGHEASGMKGTLTITRGAAAPGAPGQVADPGAPDTPGSPGTPADPGSPGSPGAPGGAPSGPAPRSSSHSIQVSGLFGFSVTRLEAPPGPVTLTLANGSPLAHNIAIKGNGIDARGPEVGQGGNSTVTVTLAEGTYTFYCVVAGHEASGMTGTLVVTASGSGPGPGTGPGSGAGGGSTAQDGQGLFRANCGGCHTLAAAGTTGRIGPNLDDKHPDADKAMKKMREGDDPMPSFRGVLTDPQMRMVAGYVAASVGRR